MSSINLNQESMKERSTFLWSRLRLGQDIDESAIKHMRVCGWGKYTLAEWEKFKQKNIAEWDSDKDDPHEKVVKLLNEHYIIQTNELTGSVETFRKVNGKAAENVIEEVIYCHILDKKIKYRQSDLTARIRQMGFKNLYNPIADYFKTLPKWDGETDYIQMLASCMVTKNAEDQEFWEIQFKKALVRSLACTLHGEVNRYVMTLVGAQNKGKTTFVRFVNPWGDKYICEQQPSSNNDKDNSIQITQNFIWLLDDLDIKPPKEMGYIKSLISKNLINVRKPYAKETTQDPRRINFWATSNTDNFLSDPTGNTRYLCFEFSDIKYSYSQGLIDKQLVWSQALALLNSGYNYQLTKEEQKIQNVDNERYTDLPLEVILVNKWFTKVQPISSNFKSMGEILEILAENSRWHQKVSSTALRQAFNTLGYVKDKRNGKAGFYLAFCASESDEQFYKSQEDSYPF